MWEHWMVLKRYFLPCPCSFWDTFHLKYYPKINLFKWLCKNLNKAGGVGNNWFRGNCSVWIKQNKLLHLITVFRFHGYNTMWLHSALLFQLQEACDSYSDYSIPCCPQLLSSVYLLIATQGCFPPHRFWNNTSSSSSSLASPKPLSRSPGVLPTSRSAPDFLFPLAAGSLQVVD